jgi:hypothetical protein
LARYLALAHCDKRKMPLMRKHPSWWLFMLLLLSLGIAGWRCQRQASPGLVEPLREGAPEARASRGLPRVVSRLLVIYQANDPLRQEVYRNQVERMRLRTTGPEIVVVSDSALAPETLAENAVLLLGAPHKHPALKDWLSALPFQLDETSLRFQGVEYTDSSAVLNLANYPHPFQTQLPVFVLAGRDDRAVLAVLEEYLEEGVDFFRRAGFGYTLYLHGVRRLLGNFDRQSGGPDPRVRFAFESPDREVARNRAFRFIARGFEPDERLLVELSRESEHAIQNMEQFLERSSAGEVFPYYLYPSAEIKGLRVRHAERVHLEASAAHGVLHPAYAGLYGGQEIELPLRQYLGSARLAALGRGLAIYFTPRWQGRGYRHWAARLAAADMIPALGEWLPDERFQQGPSLIHEALSGAFTAFLIERWGKETFLERYPIWAPSPKELESLEKPWRSWLERLAPEESHGLRRDFPISFAKGFNFTHEGYQLYNGYGSRLADEALSRIAELGANSVALVPYTFMADPGRAAPLRISARPGSETDESLVHSAHTARTLGLRTLLKPQIWLGRGHWPGDINMVEPQDWPRFFQYYRQWIGHYAMLAEIHGFNALCAGVEMVKTTRRHPEEWRRLIHDLRYLFSGPVTYAANWGEEFENLLFADALDFVGLNCYYPLCPDTIATPQQLRAGFAKALAKAENVAKRSEKPVMLTEIGFSSVDHPWTNPHSDAYEREYNEAHQQLCYEIVLEGIRDKSWIGGILWWKYPTYLDYAGRQGGKGFAVNGKAVEKTIADGFKKRW